MKCPLFIAAVVIKGGTSKGAKVECLKETCAWWNESIEKCCIPVLAANAIVLNSFLQQLADKMPHEEAP